MRNLGGKQSALWAIGENVSGGGGGEQQSVLWGIRK